MKGEGNVRPRFDLEMQWCNYLTNDEMTRNQI